MRRQVVDGPSGCARAAEPAPALEDRGPDPIESDGEKAGLNRLRGLYASIDLVRRGGTVWLTRVYGEALDLMPRLRMLDKQLQIRMGQAKVWRRVPDMR